MNKKIISECIHIIYRILKFKMSVRSTVYSKICKSSSTGFVKNTLTQPFCVYILVTYMYVTNIYFDVLYNISYNEHSFIEINLTCTYIYTEKKKNITIVVCTCAYNILYVTRC